MVSVGAVKSLGKVVGHELQGLARILPVNPETTMKFSYVTQKVESDLTKILGIGIPNKKPEQVIFSGLKLSDLFETFTKDELKAKVEAVRKNCLAIKNFISGKSFTIFPNPRKEHILKTPKFHSDRVPWETLSDKEILQIIEFKQAGLYYRHTAEENPEYASKIVEKVLNENH